MRAVLVAFHHILDLWDKVVVLAVAQLAMEILVAQLFLAALEQLDKVTQEVMPGINLALTMVAVVVEQERLVAPQQVHHQGQQMEV